MSSNLFVTFCSDTEDNHPNYLPYWQKMGSDYNKNPALIRWDWTKYWTSLKTCFEEFSIPVTWLIRVDDGPIYDAMLTHFKSEILELPAEGDEVGIHIHTLVWNQSVSKWVQTTNLDQEEVIVRRSLNYFRSVLGFIPTSVRMGWNTMSNRIMQVLDESNLVVDASAIPDNYCPGKFGGRDNFYDWRGTPYHPYHPSSVDYRLPGNLKITEMPLQVLPSSNFANNLINRLSNRNVISAILRRFLPLTRKFSGFNPNNYFYISPYWGNDAVVKIIRYSIKAARDGFPVFVVGFFHSSDILDPKTGKENVSFKQSISSTISAILSMKNEVNVKFLTLTEAALDFSNFVTDNVQSENLR